MSVPTVDRARIPAGVGCLARPGARAPVWNTLPGEPSRRSIRPDPRHPFTFDSPAQGGGLVALPGVHVLLVEDNADARDIVRRVLEHCGALVTTAESPAAALRRLRTMKGRPDILVSDLALPDQDGYWLLRQVRARDRLSALPAIAITAHRNEYDREETLAAGFQDYFQKPLDLVLFARAIARLTDR